MDRNGLSESRSWVTPARSVTGPCALALPAVANTDAASTDIAARALGHRCLNSTTYHLFLHDCEEITRHSHVKSTSTERVVPRRNTSAYGGARADHDLSRH